MESKKFKDKNKTQLIRKHNDDSTITDNNNSNVETESSQSSNIDIKQEISECNQNPQIHERPKLNFKVVKFKYCIFKINRNFRLFLHSLFYFIYLK